MLFLFHYFILLQKYLSVSRGIFICFCFEVGLVLFFVVFVWFLSLILCLFFCFVFCNYYFGGFGEGLVVVVLFLFFLYVCLFLL